MTENYSKLRQQAEAAFGKAQSQLFERQRAIEDLNSIVIARDERPRGCGRLGLPRNCTTA
ncbi:hypothetical protein ACFQEX_19940 [Roseibium salinum]|uniref:hypothetical protein n=1 Tax=Roseibium salinum TaxID=1604349 RepID=UPI003615E6F5